MSKIWQKKKTFGMKLELKIIVNIREYEKQLLMILIFYKMMK